MVTVHRSIPGEVADDVMGKDDSRGLVEVAPRHRNVPGGDRDRHPPPHSPPGGGPCCALPACPCALC